MSERRCGTCAHFRDGWREDNCQAPFPLSVPKETYRDGVNPEWDASSCSLWTPADKAARIALLQQQIAELEKENEL